MNPGTEEDHRRYEQPEKLLQYIEAEWGDLFFSEPTQGVSSQYFIKPGARTVPFYEQMAELIAPLIPENGKLLDVGGATGRFCAEVLRRRPDVRAYVYDTSGQIREFGLAVREGASQVVALLERKGYMAFFGRVAVPTEAVSEMIERSSDVDRLASLPESPSSFNTVVCFNVLDRIEAQEEFVRSLLSLCDGGVAAFACPFDYLNPIPSCCVDLRALIPNRFKIVFDGEVDYHMRVSRRKMTHYISQVIVVSVK